MRWICFLLGVKPQPQLLPGQFASWLFIQMCRKRFSRRLTKSWGTEHQHWMTGAGCEYMIQWRNITLIMFFNQALLHRSHHYGDSETWLHCPPSCTTQNLIRCPNKRIQNPKGHICLLNAVLHHERSRLLAKSRQFSTWEISGFWRKNCQRGKIYSLRSW